MSNAQFITTQENHRSYHSPEKYFLSVNELEQSYDYASKLVENSDHLPLKIGLAHHFSKLESISPEDDRGSQTLAKALL